MPKLVPDLVTLGDSMVRAARLPEEEYRWIARTLLLLGTGIASGAFSFIILSHIPSEPTPDLQKTILQLVGALGVVSAMVFLAAALVRLAIWRWPQYSDAAQWWVLRERRVPAVFFVGMMALVGSTVTGLVGVTGERTDNYWAAFFLWASLILVFMIAAALESFSVSTLRPARVRRWLSQHRIEFAILAALVVGALALRLFRLDSVPPVFGGDEATMGFASLRFLEGQDRNMFVVGPGSHPTMFFLVQAASMKVLGADVVGLRSVAAVLGALSVGAIYVLLRELFDRKVALVGAVLVTVWHVHLHYSRIALNNAGDPLVMASSLFLVYRAFKTQQLFYYAATGAAAGLGFYLFAGSRIVPLLVAAFMAFAILRNGHLLKPALLKKDAAGIAIMVAAYTVVVLPLALFFVGDPGKFNERLSLVSIFEEGRLDSVRAVTDYGTAGALWDQVARAFGGFVHYTDLSPTYAVPVPYLDAVTSVFLIAGVVYALFHILEERYFLLLSAFAVVVLLGGALTEMPPTSSRVIGAFPATVGLAAVGLYQLSRRLFFWPRAGLAAVGLYQLSRRLSSWQQALVPVVLMVALLPPVVTNLDFYFNDFPDRPYTGGINGLVEQRVVGFMQDRGASPDTRIYWHGAPRIFANSLTMAFQLRDQPPQIGVRAGEPVARPTAASPAVFIYLPERESEYEAMVQLCPGGETDIVLNGDVPLFIVYDLPLPNTCSPPET